MDLRRAFYADTWWGIAAAVWLATGLARAFGGLEKGAAYYLHNHAFWAKMMLFALILALEIMPMVTLIRWRGLVARGEWIDTRVAPRLVVISYLEAVLVMLMVLAATAMARGLGAGN
jgi:putative membrane protein